MGIKRALARYQQNVNNAGWRIKEISWRPAGELEVIRPKSFLIGFLILGGIAAFIGGMWLTITYGNIYLIVSGLGFAGMLLSVPLQGRKAYANFEPVDAECIDREILYFRELGDSGGSWAARLLCRYQRDGKDVFVTPIIPWLIAPNSRQACERFLDKRIINNRCRLWVDPNNPLHTSFHRKPIMQVRGD